MPNAERKLIVLLVGCRNLPPHAATGVNDAYISLRLKEDYEQFAEPQHATDPFDFALSMNFENSTIIGNSTATDDKSSSQNLQRKQSVARSKSVSIAAADSSTTADPFSSFTGGAPSSPSAMQKQQSALSRRMSTDRRRSTLSSTLPQMPKEHVSQYLHGQKQQSKMVRSTSSPEYGELFIFENLPIPLRRRSSSILINNSLTGGSNPLVVRAEASDKHKMNQRFTLHVDVYDNTSVKGLGEMICTCDIPLDDLPQGKRTTMWVPLHVCPCTSLMSPPVDLYSAFDGTSDEERQAKIDRQARALKPVIGFVLEPVNFGVLEERIRNESPPEALLRALHEELHDTCSDEFISKVHQMVVRAEEAGMDGFTKEEMGLFLQELYFFAGVSVPADQALEEEAAYLFSLFDKSVDDVVNISELCGVIKMSSLMNSLGPRWRRGRHEAAKVVAASSIAGCLWEPQKIPAAMEYAGYRKTDGSVNPKTKVPSKVHGWVQHKAKPYVNLYKELYGDEEQRLALLAEETKRLQQEEDTRRMEEEERIARGEPPKPYVDDTVPMFQQVAPKKNPQYTAAREERSLAQLFAPPSVKSPNDNDLPSITFDKLSKCIVEYTELKHCEATSVQLIGCRIVGGRYVDCILESCVLTGGAEVVGARSLRCSDLSRARITTSNPVNSRITWCHLRECELVAQCSLTDCDVSSGSFLIHCYLKECNVDSTAKDGGANVFDMCRMLPVPKVPVGEQLLL